MRIFTKGEEEKGRRHEGLRRSRFKSFALAEMHAVIGEHGFPFLRTGLGTLRALLNRTHCELIAGSASAVYLSASDSLPLPGVVI